MTQPLRPRILPRRELLMLARTVLTDGGAELDPHKVEALALGCVLLDSDVRSGRDDLERERELHWASRAELEAAKTEIIRGLAAYETAIRERDEARALVLDSLDAARDRASRGIIQMPFVEASATLDALLLADPPDSLPWRDDPDTLVVEVPEPHGEVHA